MAEHISQCAECRRYTLEKKCPSCHKETFRPLPPKFVLPDKYGKYRREVRREELKVKELY